MSDFFRWLRDWRNEHDETLPVAVHTWLLGVTERWR